jgi:hypothetical protein
MDKITEALKKILPEDQVSEVAKAVEDMMAEQVTGLEAEFQAKLDEAYEQVAAEKQTDEQITEQGYQQAYEIVASLMNRLDEQREEFETALEEGFEEAYQELTKEKGKNDNIEVGLYEEFDKKLQEMKNFMVDKVDQFLNLQEAEIYEHAKRDILSDPTLAEQRVIVEKMAELLAHYVESDDLCAVSTSKLEEAIKTCEDIKGQMRIVEARNVKLSAQNNRLNEQVKEANELLTEAAKTDKKVRAGKAKNASGRGQRVVADQVIAEHTTEPTQGDKKDLTEGTEEPLNDLLVLSGIVEQ